MSGISGPKIITSGCVLSLDAADIFSYPRTGTTWRDLSGNNNNGTLTNGPTFSAGNQGSIVFDGIDDYVNVANASSLNASAQTISVWYNATVLPGRESVLVAKHDTVGSWNGYNMWAGNNTQIKVGSTGYNSGLGTGVTNVWYHLTLAYTSNVSLTGYVNGVSMGTSGLANLSISSNPLRIGRSPDSFWSAFTGKIAQVSVYNRQLSDIEILQNYNATKSRFGL